jgi:hypothetical protein
VREAFQRGAITAAHVREIVRAAAIVREAIRAGSTPQDALVLYDTAAVIVAEKEAPARTGTYARELASALAGETTTERHEHYSKLFYLSTSLLRLQIASPNSPTALSMPASVRLPSGMLGQSTRCAQIC